MPISLRLPAEVEAEIAGYSARHGMSKSAVIVRSIAEFMANHAQPSSFQIYQEAMREVQGQHSDARHPAEEQRPSKLQVREAIRGKHTNRSVRATEALARSGLTARKSA